MKMNDEQIKRIIEDTYEDAKENSIMSMASDFYSRRMLSIVVLVWVWGIIFFAGAVFSAIKFFKTVGVQSQIMYAAIFICCCQFLALMKIFAWQVIHRNSLKRELKRLELRIAQLTDSLAERTPRT